MTNQPSEVSPAGLASVVSPDADDTAALASPPRPYVYQVARRTFAGWGSRLGLIWILLIAFCGVFAPLLASSHPYVMKTKAGEITFPLFRHLNPADVILMVMAVVLVVLLGFYKVGLAKRMLVFFVALVLVIPLAIAWVDPPRAVVYQKYRQMERANQVDWMIRPPIAYSPADRLRDQTGISHPLAPDASHLMGTESSGGDILARMIHASRIALSVGFIATGIALVIGVIIGGLMGYFSGLVDLLGMRLVEIFEAIPQLYLLLAFVAFFPRNLYLMMAIIGLTSWTGYCRFLRAEFLKLRAQDYVQAALAAGLPLRSVLFRHMLPNGIAPVLVGASFGVPSAILAEATLSFLGLGLVDEPSWGQMLNQAAVGGGFTWWLAIYPGLAIFLTVFAYNLIGEALRDAIDPYVNRG